MSSNIQLFDYNENAVRTVLKEDGTIWFVGKDIGNCLEIENYRNVIDRLDDDEKGVHSMDTLGGAQKMICINEPGLYKMIFTSRKEAAKAFQRWVTHEVLPQIRANGFYAMPESAAETSAPLPAGSGVLTDDMLETGLVEDPSQPLGTAPGPDMLTYLALVREARQVWGHVVAREMWRGLPLPQPPRDEREAAHEDDPDLKFLDDVLEGLRSNSQEPVPSHKIYNHYVALCQQEGMRPCSGKLLGMMCRRKFRMHRSSRFRSYLGLTLPTLN